MNKQSQKRIIQINHALSGLYGQEIKNTAFKINDIRKQLLKKLQRKKKLSSIIHDQLYSYLQKFPQQRLGLHQQSFKKKKARLSQSQQRSIYRTPMISEPETQVLMNQKSTVILKLNSFFKYPLQIDQNSSQYKESNDAN